MKYNLPLLAVLFLLILFASVALGFFIYYSLGIEKTTSNIIVFCFSFFLTKVACNICYVDNDTD
jgi:hypothetical protein